MKLLQTLNPTYKLRTKNQTDAHLSDEQFSEGLQGLLKLSTASNQP